eukprot:GHVT01016428.1.p2 GENE.GHVT01016428.1~~GHVT01016428.1.p2  ORF type:complete len:214 (+),score=55.52 GHVT01016428.1:719-1360(+)
MAEGQEKRTRRRAAGPSGLLRCSWMWLLFFKCCHGQGDPTQLKRNRLVQPFLSSASSPSLSSASSPSLSSASSPSLSSASSPFLFSPSSSSSPPQSFASAAVHVSCPAASVQVLSTTLAAFTFTSTFQAVPTERESLDLIIAVTDCSLPEASLFFRWGKPGPCCPRPPSSSTSSPPRPKTSIGAARSWAGPPTGPPPPPASPSTFASPSSDRR